MQADLSPVPQPGLPPGQGPQAGRPTQAAAARRVHRGRRLAAYGTVAGPVVAAPAPGSADRAALASQLRKLAGDRIDEALDWYHGDSGGAQSSVELSGLSLSDSSPGPMPELSPPRALAAAVGSNAAGTNVAERLVDEPDVAKLDGTRIVRLAGRPSRGSTFAIARWRLAVVGASADQLRLLGTYRPRFRHSAHELFILDGHRVLVVGSVHEPAEDEDEDDRTSSKIVLTLLDTADPSRMRLLRQEKVTGRYVSARMSGGVVRVVLSTPPALDVSDPVLFEPRALTAARNPGRAALPRRRGLAARPRGPARGRARRGVRARAGVRRLPPSHPAVRTRPALRARDRLRGRARRTRPGEGCRRRRRRGRRVRVDGPALHGLRAPRDRDGGGPLQTTTIHAFDTSGRGTPHVASGTVDGRLISSSALSAHDGRLRVAPGRFDKGWTNSNGVAVLEESGRALAEVGRLVGLGGARTSAPCAGSARSWAW